MILKTQFTHASVFTLAIVYCTDIHNIYDCSSLQADLGRMKKVVLSLENKLNILKCNHILFTKKQNLILMNSTEWIPLQVVKEAKYFGVLSLAAQTTLYFLRITNALLVSEATTSGRALKCPFPDSVRFFLFFVVGGTVDTPNVALALEHETLER